MNSIDFVQMGFFTDQRTPEVMERSHAHVELEVNYLLSGYMRYYAGGKYIHIPARRFVIFWATLPHQLVETHPGTEAIWITLPLAWFFSRNLPSPLLDSLFRGEWIISSESLVSKPTMTRWVDELKGDNPQARKAAILELEATMRRIAVETYRDETLQIQSDSGHAEKICQFLIRNYSKDVGVREVSDHLGFHPNAAMRSFRRATNMTILQYLTQVRIAMAQRLLLETDLSVDQVGQRSGFHSQSQFFAVFKKHTALSPGNYRVIGKSV